MLGCLVFFHADDQASWFSARKLYVVVMIRRWRISVGPRPRAGRTWHCGFGEVVRSQMEIVDKCVAVGLA